MLKSKEERGVMALEDLARTIQDETEMPALKDALRETARADVESILTMVKALPLAERLPLLRRVVAASSAIKDELGEEEWVRQGGEDIVVSNRRDTSASSRTHQARIPASQEGLSYSSDGGVRRRGGRDGRARRVIGESDVESEDELPRPPTAVRKSKRIGRLPPTERRGEHISELGMSTHSEDLSNRQPRRRWEAWVEIPVFKNARTTKPASVSASAYSGKTSSVQSHPRTEGACDRCMRRRVDCERPHEDRACRSCSRLHVACKIDGKHSTPSGLKISMGKRRPSKR